MNEAAWSVPAVGAEAQPWPFSPWAHEVECGARCCPPGRAGWSERRKGPSWGNAAVTLLRLAAQ